MSCAKCDDKPVETYVRVGAANVMIVGCEDHLRQLLDQNRLGMNVEQKLTTIAAVMAEELYADDPDAKDTFMKNTATLIARYLEGVV